MNPLIWHVPAIRRLSLTGIGCWDALSLEFAPALNIVTGTGGSGKSTILRAIRYAVNPLDNSPYSLAPARPFAPGRIEIEFLGPEISVDWPARDGAPANPGKGGRLGQIMLACLRSCLQEKHRGMALLVEDDITSCLDDELYDQAAALLNGAGKQVICLIHSHRFSAGDFPGARVYRCYIGDEDSHQIEKVQ
ncbi:MAG: recombination protein F [Syntrophaceae bacterium PtaB.Bin095]|nr:MAG: recombination protein F [Syntrophaceae bacterium PtaB.Bin095]